MTTEPAETQIVRWYTRARRFPQLIGRTPDGARLPGGPYTIPQVLAGAGVFVAGSMTRSVWGAWGTVGDTLFLLAAAGIVGFLVGKVPLGGRNPFTAGLGAISALTAPPRGKVAGRPVRIRRPHRVTHRTVVQNCGETAAPASRTPVELAAPQVEPVAVEPALRTVGSASAQSPSVLPAAAAPTRPVTGVQALLAAGLGGGRNTGPNAGPNAGLHTREPVASSAAPNTLNARQEA